MTPQISLITITFNSARYLEHTIRSIVEQTFESMEYIVVDGGSTDGTLEIIKKYDAKIDRWISESDEGIADAMNKGLAMASGEYILFIHSDDYLLEPTVLAKAAQYLSPLFDIFLFTLYRINGEDRVLFRSQGFSRRMNFKTGVFHQGAICSKKLFQRIGNFETCFCIEMDYEFFLRAYREGATACHIDMPLSVMRLVGVSSQTDWPALRERFYEEKVIHRMHCPNVWMALLYHLYWPPYLFYRKICSLRWNM